MCNNIDNLLWNLQHQFEEDIKFKVFPSFIRTSDDKSILNKLRINLYGLLLIGN